jgi:hypothetical protein
MITCAVVSITYSIKTTNPEILGSVSCMIRDSRYFNAPPGLGKLDSEQMMRRLRDMKLRMGSVGVDSEGMHTWL